MRKVKVFSVIAFAALMLMSSLPFVGCSAEVGGPGFFEDASMEFTEFSKGADIETTAELPNIIGSMISVVLGFLGIFLLVLILYAGWLWMSAGGESKQVDKAKDYIKNAVIGLVIILLAYAITSFVIDKIMVVQSGVK